MTRDERFSHAWVGGGPQHLYPKQFLNPRASLIFVGWVVFLLEKVRLLQVPRRLWRHLVIVKDRRGTNDVNGILGQIVIDDPTIMFGVVGNLQVHVMY